MMRNINVGDKNRSNVIWQIRRPFSAAAVICLGLICGLPTSNAMAEITRHCDAEVKIVERGTPHVAIYNFTVHKTVDRSKAYANELRRNLKRHIVSCLRDHWHIRDSGAVPRDCLDDDAVRRDFINYPFNNLNEDIIQAVCPELRPGADDVTKHIDMMLTITGERGCNISNFSIAENVAIACPHAEVTLERIENEAQPAGSGGGSSAAQEQPVIGDGGGSGCVGAGCGGSEPATEDEQPSALPNITISEFSLNPATPTKGQPVQVRIGIYNNGAAAAGPYRVEWYPGENYPEPGCSWDVSGNNASGGKILNCTYAGYPSRYGQIRTKVVADPGGQVNELNEGDNTQFMQVRVLGSQTDAEAEPAAEEHPADDGLPATASYNLLPIMRLPGNDLRMIEMSSPNWMLCRQACTDDTRCKAYTYRAPNANSGPICLLKSGVGMRIPDPCCQSGVKR